MLSPVVMTNLMVGVSVIICLYGFMFDTSPKQVYRHEIKNKLKKR
jgi:hypothetical protein